MMSGNRLKIKKFAARKIFTGTKERPWVTNGIVYLEDDGTILNVSKDNALQQEQAEVAYYDGILVPGLVNAHLHLELSWLEEPKKKFNGLSDFVGSMRKLNYGGVSNEYKEKKAALYDALMSAEGVVLAADIVNTRLTVALKRNSKVEYVNFVEVFGLLPVAATSKIKQAKTVYESFVASGLDAHFAPHSTYALSSELYGKLAVLLRNENISSIHFLEGKGEKSLFENAKRNEFAAVLKEFSAELPYDLWHGGTVNYLKGLFSPTTSLLLVHNTFSDKETVKSVKAEFPNAYFVLCPSSNWAVEQTMPSQEIFADYADFLLVGTDSTATNRTGMSLTGEMNLLLKAGWPLETVLYAVTLNGAKALHKEVRYGSLEAGKKPGLTQLKIGYRNQIVEARKIL